MKKFLFVMLLLVIYVFLILSPSEREKEVAQMTMEEKKEVKAYDLSSEFYMFKDEDNIQIKSLKGILSKKEIRKYYLND